MFHYASSTTYRTSSQIHKQAITKKGRTLDTSYSEHCVVLLVLINLTD